MTAKEKAKCKIIANNIKLGKYGNWETEKENILDEITKEYNLTEEMKDYIISLIEGENK